MNVPRSLHAFPPLQAAIVQSEDNRELSALREWLAQHGRDVVRALHSAGHLGDSLVDDKVSTTVCNRI